MVITYSVYSKLGWKHCVFCVSESSQTPDIQLVYSVYSKLGWKHCVFCVSVTPKLCIHHLGYLPTSAPNLPCAARSRLRDPSAVGRRGGRAIDQPARGVMMRFSGPAEESRRVCRLSDGKVRRKKELAPACACCKRRAPASFFHR